MFKYFGSGVIVATAFIHLLAPANEALTNPCLTGAITEYSWVEGIVLIVVFVMFFLELMTMRYATFGHEHGHEHEHNHDVEMNRQARSKKVDQRSVSSSALASKVSSTANLPTGCVLQWYSHELAAR